MSYDWCIITHDYFSYDWKVTRSLVSYDSTSSTGVWFSLNWKVTRSLVSYDFTVTIWRPAFKDWKVTRSLVSYDFSCVCSDYIIWLKGHQIIGELRLLLKDCSLPSALIERSPDHWWVTTTPLCPLCPQDKLKGHQIIGELRRSCISHDDLLYDWKVTRSLVSYDLSLVTQRMTNTNWKVTRSLVSYDQILCRFYK